MTRAASVVRAGSRGMEKACTPTECVRRPAIVHETLVLGPLRWHDEPTFP